MAKHRPERDAGGTTVSPWALNAAHEMPLSADTTAEVCVVGAGIAELSCAYLLAREGYSVVVLDHGEIGSGQTHRTTAHLASELDDRYAEVEKIVGGDKLHLIAESHSAAIDCIEQIA